MSDTDQINYVPMFGLSFDRPKQIKLKENGEIGDCWRACIACILQILPEEVPHFVELFPNDANAQTAKWLRDRGIWLIESTRLQNPDWNCPEQEDAVFIATGPSPRSKNMTQHHAVVMQNRRVVYDPHPSEAGLTAVIYEYILAGMYRPKKQP